MATKPTDAQYKSAYSTMIDGLVNKAINREPFQYDPATDPAYQAYARQYTRLGDEAGRDTLADVSANTGGLASSYAVTASQQARNQYNQALTDKIPALMETAYNKYRNDYNDTLAGISTLQGLDDSAFNRFANTRDFNENVRQFGLNYALEQEKFKESQRQFNKNYDLDMKKFNEDVRQFGLNYALENNKFKENIRQYNQNYELDKGAQEFEQMLNRWTTLGYATSEVAKYFGIPEGTKTDDSSYRWAQFALQQASAGSSGGSGGGSSGGRSRGRSGSRSSSGGSSSSTSSTSQYVPVANTNYLKAYAPAKVAYNGGSTVYKGAPTAYDVDKSNTKNKVTKRYAYTR